MHEAGDADAAFVEGEFEAAEAGGAIEEERGVVIGVVGTVIASHDEKGIGGARRIGI